MSTFIASAQHAVENSRWHVIDADGQVLGRIATVAARLLQGKHKPIYTPFIDTGDHIVVVNAAKVKLTGRKEEQNEYMFFSGFVGGESYRKVSLMRERHPEFIIERAVKGMLPKNRIAATMLKKLRVFAGPNHTHQAANPQKISV